MPGASDHLLGQQLQRPARSPRRRVRTRYRDQQRLFVPAELATRPHPRRFAQCRLQTLLDEALLGAIHRRRPRSHRGRNHRVAMSLFGGKQHLRAFDPAHPRLARAGQFLQLHAFLFVELDDVSLTILQALAEADAPLSQRRIRERAATRHRTVGAIVRTLVREGRDYHDAEGRYRLVTSPSERAVPLDAANVGRTTTGHPQGRREAKEPRSGLDSADARPTLREPPLFRRSRNTLGNPPPIVRNNRGEIGDQTICETTRQSWR